MSQSIFAVALSLTVACVSTSSTSVPAGDPASPSSAVAPPALVVMIVVDQLRGDEPQRYASVWKKGMKRLLEEGRIYTRARHGHARTETAAGHATIATGLHPRWHGVIDKRLYEPMGRGIVKICEWGRGPCDPSVLLEPTLGDRLKRRSPGSVVVSLSAKDRAATLMGGQGADLVAWLGDEPFGLVGRTGPTPTLPVWLTEEAARLTSVEERMSVWTLPELPEPFAGWPDAHPDEADPGHGTTFPHVLPPSKTLADVPQAWLYTPDPDRVVAQLALTSAFRYRMGRDGPADLLWISLSSTDRVGHAFGPDSLERAAMMVALDETLGQLLEGIEKIAGGRVIVGLTSDHGIAPTLGHARSAGHGANRITRAVLQEQLEAALDAQLGAGDWIGAVLPPHIFLRPMSPDAAERVIAATVSVARAHPFIREARAASEVLDSVSEQDQLLRENNHVFRGSAVLFTLEPYHGVLHGSGDRLGAQHGTTWEYDRHVPVILWGDGVAPGRVDLEVPVTALSRTLADRLGLEPDPRWPAALP